MIEENFNFETAFVRLEAILERMNTGSIALDESLKLYEEADKLISQSSAKLVEAENKIEVLMKKRSGELELDATSQPLKHDFKE